MLLVNNKQCHEAIVMKGKGVVYFARIIAGDMEQNKCRPNLDYGSLSNRSAR